MMEPLGNPEEELSLVSERSGQPVTRADGPGGLGHEPSVTVRCGNCDAELTKDAARCVICGHQTGGGSPLPSLAREMAERKAAPRGSALAHGASRWEAPQASAIARLAAAVGRIVGLGLAGLLVVYVACRWVAPQVTCHLAGSQIEAISSLRQARRLSKFGTGDLADKEKAAAVKISRALEGAPHFFGVYTRKVSRRGLKTVARIDYAMGKIVGALPSDTDLAPLLEIPQDWKFSYREAFQAVATRAGIPWLIERSCDQDPNVRSFAAQVLKRHIPFQRVDDSELRALSAQQTVEAKRLLYDGLYENVHRALVKEWVGSYRLRIDAVWQDSRSRSTAFEGELLCLSVAAEGTEWIFTLFGKSVAVPGKELASFTMKRAIADVADHFTEFEFYPKIEGSSLLVDGPDGTIRARIEPYPSYRYARDFWGRSTLRYGFRKLDVRFVRME